MKTPIIVCISLSLFSCTKSTTIQIGENTFMYNGTVYRIIDNQITELGSMESDSIPKSTVLRPQLKNFGQYSLGYIKAQATSTLLGVYRGDVLYYKLEINDLNDLRDRFSGGAITLNFLDSYGFEIQKTDIPMSDLVSVLNDSNKTIRFEFNGKVQMSSEMHRSIIAYSVSSSLRKKSYFGW